MARAVGGARAVGAAVCALLVVAQGAAVAQAPVRPSNDRDEDGVVDREDRCPAETEDLDGYQDLDGCPDPDNDGDGVIDMDDVCPAEAGLRELRGCPPGRGVEAAPQPAPAASVVPTPAAAAPASVAPGRAVETAAWVVAVMMIENSGAAAVALPLRKGLTDQLRVFLGARRVRVIDRGAMDAAFRELMSAEKANSYASCVDEACQIPLGKALAATHILRTTIGRFGASCTLNAELVDLAREVSAAAVSKRTTCKDAALLDAAEAAVESLVREAR